MTTAGTYTPKPGAAPLPRMIRAQAALETKMLLRNGEQLLLTVIIPTLLLVMFSSVDIIDTGKGKSVDFLAPGILALAVMSTAFTGQAIATGFERRYGVLKRLAASPLPRWGLMTAKTASVLVTEVLQVILLTVIAFALGWSPHGNPFAVLLLLILGTAAFSGLGLLMGRHSEGGGDAGRREPGLPAAPRGRRRDRPDGQVPLRRPGRAGPAAHLGAFGRPAGRAPARGGHAVGRPGDPGRVGGRGPGSRGQVLPLGVAPGAALMGCTEMAIWVGAGAS